MALSKEQTQYFQTTLEVSRRQIDEINAEIAKELARAQDRLGQLKDARDAAKEIYDVACRMLGLENEIDRSLELESAGGPGEGTAE
jgi:ElaB/YqjD/DUF883 family membrane-anchored ribosome-binding protein